MPSQNKLLPLFILILALLTLTQQRIRTAQNVENQVSQIRKSLVGRTLMLRWKLAEQDNFRLNAKNIMINKQSQQRKRSSSTQSFFQPSEVARRGWAFFQAQQKDAPPSKLYVELYDDDYSTGPKVIMEIPLSEDMQSGLTVDKDGFMLWQSNKSQFISCLLLRGDTMIGKFNVEAKIQIDTNIQAGRPFVFNDRVWLNFYSQSFVYFSDLQPVTTEYDLFSYLTLLCSIAFFVLVVFLKSKRSVYNLSEWMIVQVAAYILITNIILLGVGFVRLDTRMWLVSLCAFANIGLSLFFLRNYEDVVWNEFNTRRRVLLLTLFLGIYFALVGFYWTSQLFWIYEGFILFATQVSYAYSKGGRGGMPVKLVLTILVTRLPFSYYRFLMEDVTKLPNSPILIVAFIGSNIILLTFIALQRYFGSRFLIPKELIPDYFDYFITKVDSEVLKEQCSICSVTLGEDPDKVEDASNSSHASVTDATEQQIVRVKVTLMITPCNHKFHPSCLQDWMDKRLNCPMCRSTLPPSEQQRDDSYCC